MKHRLRPHRSVSLLHGIMRTAIACTPSRSCRVTRDVVDHHVHVRGAKLQMNWARASRSQQPSWRDHRCCRHDMAFRHVRSPRDLSTRRGDQVDPAWTVVELKVQIHPQH